MSSTKKLEYRWASTTETSVFANCALALSNLSSQPPSLKSHHFLNLGSNLAQSIIPRAGYSACSELTHEPTPVTCSNMLRRIFIASAIPPVFAHELPDQAQKRIRLATLDEIHQWIDKQTVLTFLGYSGAEYESHANMMAKAATILSMHDPANVLVNIGATSDGIGSVYLLAKQLGFKTMGIVSTQAVASGASWSPAVDQIFLINDTTWGGADASGGLHPTSAAIVTLSDEMVAIGGGAIARDELLAGQRLGRRCQFIPAESNHKLARAKAIKAKQPEPTNFASALGTTEWTFP